MSTKTCSEQKQENKLIKCENCRQDILSDKMFLHEGFCHRNNVFCEHCEKVFLKTDYEHHIKELPKNLTTKKSESNLDSKKSTSNEEEKPIIEHTLITIAPKPTLEFVQMPLVEEISINAPIIITETGQIVSNKNKNDYLLPFLGINTTQISNMNNNIIKQDIFAPQMESINSYKLLKNNFSDAQTRNNIKYNYNANNKKEPLKFSSGNNNDIIKNDLLNNNSNKIIINNNIITFNNNKMLTKKNNNYTPTKALSSEKKSISPQDKPKKLQSKKPLNKTKVIKKNYHFPKNPNEKTPTDSKSKSKLYKLLTEPNRNIKKKFKDEYGTQCITDEKTKIIKKCGYCNMIINDPSEHFKKCKSKRISDNNNKIKNKTEEKEIRDSLLLKNIDEFGIEEKNKKILHREFIPSLNAFSINSRDISPMHFTNHEIDNRQLLVKTQDRNYRKNIIFVKNDENSRSVERIKKNIFYYYRNSPENLRYRRENKKDYFTEYINNNENDIITNKKNGDRKVFLRI